MHLRSCIPTLSTVRIKHVSLVACDPMIKLGTCNWVKLVAPFLFGLTFLVPPVSAEAFIFYSSITQLHDVSLLPTWIDKGSRAGVQIMVSKFFLDHIVLWSAKLFAEKCDIHTICFNHAYNRLSYVQDSDLTSMNWLFYEFQPSSARGTHSPPAMPHLLLNPKWPLGVPKIADGVWKVIFPYVFERSNQVSLSNFFDLKTPSVRKSLDGEGKNGKCQPSVEGGTRSPPATPHRLQRRTVCQWAPKWPTGSGKVSTPRFWGAPVNFR